MKKQRVTLCMARYYVDTCIWRDYYENRSDGKRPLGEWAFRFLQNSLGKKDTIIVSDVLIDELSEFDSIRVFQAYRPIIIFVRFLEEDKVTALAIHEELRLPLGDITHALIARRNDAILITRDRHFNKLRHLVTVLKPEECTCE